MLLFDSLKLAMGNTLDQKGLALDKLFSTLVEHSDRKNGQQRVGHITPAEFLSLRKIQYLCLCTMLCIQCIGQSDHLLNMASSVLTAFFSNRSF